MLMPGTGRADGRDAPIAERIRLRFAEAPVRSAEMRSTRRPARRRLRGANRTREAHRPERRRRNAALDRAKSDGRDRVVAID